MHFGDRVDRRIGNLRRRQFRRNGFQRRLPRRRADFLVDRRAVGVAGLGRVARAVLRDGDEPVDRRQPAPLGVAADGDVDVAVARRVDAGRDELAVGVAPAADLLRIAVQVDQRQQGDQPRRGGLEHGNVDPPAAGPVGALGQRQQDIGIDLVAGLEVDHRHAHQGRRPVLESGHFHIAAHGLDDRIVAGDLRIVRPHGGNAGPDQPRFDGAQGFVVDAERFVAARDRVAGEDVGVELADHPVQGGLAFRRLEIEGDALLADILRQEIGIGLDARHRPADIAVGVAGLVAAAGRLDPHDAPAELHEAHRRVRHRERLFHGDEGASLHLFPPPLFAPEGRAGLRSLSVPRTGRRHRPGLWSSRRPSHRPSPPP